MDNNTFPILDIIHENLHFTPSKCTVSLAHHNPRPNSRSSDGDRFIVTPTIDERKGRVVYRRGSLGNSRGENREATTTTTTLNVKERIGELKNMSKTMTAADNVADGRHANSQSASCQRPRCSCLDQRHVKNSAPKDDSSRPTSPQQQDLGSDLKNVFLANGCRRLYEIQNRRVTEQQSSKESRRRPNHKGPQKGPRMNSFLSNGRRKPHGTVAADLNLSDGEGVAESNLLRHLFGRTPKKLSENRFLLHSLIKAYCNSQIQGHKGKDFLSSNDGGYDFYQRRSCSDFHLSEFLEEDEDEWKELCNGGDDHFKALNRDDAERVSVEEYHMGILHEGWKKYSSLSRLFTCWQPLEGQLSKYTNVMKGWQFRWFVLNPEQGKLEYFEKEEHKKMQRPSRGSLMLAGAVICPSDEDSQTFIVNAANGEVYRLKAFDAKERQHWVNRLRATAEYHVDFMPYSKAVEHVGLTQCSLAQKLGNESLVSSSSSSSSFQSSFFSRQQAFHIPFKSQNKLSQAVASCLNTPSFIASDACHATVTSSIKNCAQQLSFVQEHANALHIKIEKLPTAGSHLNALDKELLLLKASSSSALTCLQQCLHILQYQASQSPANLNCSIRSAGELISTDELSMHLSPLQSTSAPSSLSINNQSKSPGDQEENDETKLKYKYKDTVEDVDLYSDTDLGAIEEHKSVILELLSQLKLGMDLTKVVLPTFILEKRSLLEMFADCMAHPDLFVSISDQTTPESRMLNVFEWYLTSFHAARQGSIAKKPYNPVVGETFHCAWQVEANNTTGSRTSASEQQQQGTHRLYYCAEQVSHHPPVSAFYFECPDKGVAMEASIWTRSKFMGMSVGVMMIGRVRLRLLKHDEEYEFSLPSAYARSILTMPWVELGDKVNIHCEKTGCSAGIVFHTKPFYGGKLHKITAETKNPSGEFICHVTGEWNGSLEFNYANGQTKTVDTTKMTVSRKCVRPIQEQDDKESRKLWLNVTENLRCGNITSATRFKHALEEEQRKLENSRREKKLPIPLKYFKLEESGDAWRFKYPLKKIDQGDNTIKMISVFE